MNAFECRRCGDCCHGEGGIFIGREETERIARFLDLGPETFLSRFCYEKNGRLYLSSGPDRFCVFYTNERRCRIHPVKPERCSLWPFYPAIVGDKENWELAKEACPGINPDGSFEDFVRESKK
ncbi:MAG: YkgJ family cysteine cluster protein [Pseudomonadota bacterium]